MTEKEDVSPCYFKKQGNLEPFKYVSLVTFHYFSHTSILSFGGCLQEPKPILRYVLYEFLNVWLNDDWENLDPYHMKNYSAKKTY